MISCHLEFFMIKKGNGVKRRHPVQLIFLTLAIDVDLVTLIGLIGVLVEYPQPPWQVITLFIGAHG